MFSFLIVSIDAGHVKSIISIGLETDVLLEGGRNLLRRLCLLARLARASDIFFVEYLADQTRGFVLIVCVEEGKSSPDKSTNRLGGGANTLFLITVLLQFVRLEEGIEFTFNEEAVSFENMMSVDTQILELRFMDNREFGQLLCCVDEKIAS